VKLSRAAILERIRSIRRSRIRHDLARFWTHKTAMLPLLATWQTALQSRKRVQEAVRRQCLRTLAIHHFRNGFLFFL